MMCRIAFACLACCVALLLSTVGETRVIRFEVVSVESPAFGGTAFGASGPYERIKARALVAVDPAEPRNAGIVDIAAAPRNAQGLVEAVADVEIVKPVDLARGNGVLFYDVLNRGRKLGLGLINDAPLTNEPSKAADAGNGFLMREGYTIVWSAWQGDLAAGGGVMLLTVPTVPNVTGTSREEIIFEHERSPAEATLAYPAAEPDPAKAVMTVRRQEADARERPAGLAFRFLSPIRIQIDRPAGYDAGAIYELIYTAKEPTVLGLGFAATRDIIAFLRRERADEGGVPNPLAPQGRPMAHRAYALGISQSGRFLRDMLYQGFNEDEAGRVVFDAMIPHIAGARRTFVNYRFAQPGRYSRQHEDHVYPGDQFPFTYGVTTDALSGRTDGVMARCLAAGHCPKIVHTDTDTEVFQARLSLLVTDSTGRHIDLPASVRAYLLSGMPHFNAIGLRAQPSPTCQAPANPLHAGSAMRALVVALDRWVKDGAEPPASRFPMRAHGTLVQPEREHAGFPTVPGLVYGGRVNGVQVVDQSSQPPKLGPQYPVLIARVDPDGHAIAGIRLPVIEAPRATYTGWNLRKAGFGDGALCSLTGAAVALAATPADRQHGDARRSIAERYPTAEAYVEAVRQAANRLVGERLLLREDADAMIAAAAEGRLAQLAN